MEKLGLDKLSNVSGGIYDPNGNAISARTAEHSMAWLVLTGQLTAVI